MLQVLERLSESNARIESRFRHLETQHQSFVVVILLCDSEGDAPVLEPFVKRCRSLNTLTDMKETHLQQLTDRMVLAKNFTKREIAFSVKHVDTRGRSLIQTKDGQESFMPPLLRVIEQNYEAADGFVVLSAAEEVRSVSASLAFAISKLSKPIVFSCFRFCETIDSVFAQAHQLIRSICVAAAFDIPEVCLLAGGRLMRAVSLTRNIDESFSCAKSAVLGSFGHLDFEPQYSNVFVGSQPSGPPLFRPATFNSAVSVVLTPVTSRHQLVQLLKSPYPFVIIESYGTGTLPMGNQWFIDLFKEPIEEKTVYTVTQCLRGFVIEEYENNFASLIIESGFDMNKDALIAKINQLMSEFNGDTLEVKRHVRRNLRGEISTEFDQTIRTGLEREAPIRKMSEDDECVIDSFMLLPQVQQSVLTGNTAALEKQVRRHSRFINLYEQINFAKEGESNIFHIFAQSDHPETFEYLKDLFSDHMKQMLRERDEFGLVPLLVAVKFGKKATFQKLLPLTKSFRLEKADYTNLQRLLGGAIRSKDLNPLSLALEVDWLEWSELANSAGQTLLFDCAMADFSEGFALLSKKLSEETKDRFGKRANDYRPASSKQAPLKS